MTNLAPKAPFRMNEAALAAQVRIQGMGATFQRALLNSPSGKRTSALVRLLMEHLPDSARAEAAALLAKGIEVRQLAAELSNPSALP